MKIGLFLIQWNALTLAEILSPLNVWGTGEEIGRSPNPNNREDRLTLMEHWVKTGGSDHFKERFELVAQS